MNTNDLALAIGELVDKKVFNASDTDPTQGFEFREFVAFIGASVGAQTQAVEQDLDSQEVLESFLQEQRQSYSGVSIDEEMTDLLRFQRSFQGTSRVISVLDSMLQEVVTGLVR